MKKNIILIFFKFKINFIIIALLILFYLLNQNTKFIYILRLNNTTNIY